MASTDQEIVRYSRGVVSAPPNMLCVYCIVNMQNDPPADLDPDDDSLARTFFVGDVYAVTISKGDAVCLPHHNVVRGWTRNYDEIRAQWESLKVD